MDANEHISFDYALQVWVVEGLIQRCGHPDDRPCACKGRTYAGLPLAAAQLAEEATPAAVKTCGVCRMPKGEGTLVDAYGQVWPCPRCS